MTVNPPPAAMAPGLITSRPTGSLQGRRSPTYTRVTRNGRRAAPPVAFTHAVALQEKTPDRSRGGFDVRIADCELGAVSRHDRRATRRIRSHRLPRPAL